MTPLLTLKVSLETVSRGNGCEFSNLLFEIMQLTADQGINFRCEAGACISPICVSGDIDLETAEDIKQKALAVVRRWESRGTK